MGSGDTLKLGYIAKNHSKIHDAKIELYTTNGQSARCIAEDIIAYCQLKLSENTKNDYIEVVKRNMANLFEDVEDPFADDFIEGNNSPPVLNKNNSKSGLRGNAAKKFGASRVLGDDYFMMDDGSQHATPNMHTPMGGGEGLNMNFMQGSIVNKKAPGLAGPPQVHQRGY